MTNTRRDPARLDRDLRASIVSMEIDAARELVWRLMRSLDHDDTEVMIIADHLIDCELHGLCCGGLSRAVSIAE